MAKKKKKISEDTVKIDNYFIKKTTPSTKDDEKDEAKDVEKDDNKVSKEFSSADYDSDTIIMTSPFKVSKDVIEVVETPKCPKRLFSLFESKSSSKTPKSTSVVVDIVDTTDTEPESGARRRTRSVSRKDESKIVDTPSRKQKKTPKYKKTKTPKVVSKVSKDVPIVDCVTIDDTDEPTSTKPVQLEPIKRHPPPLLWTEKYKPIVSSDLIGQSMAIDTFKQWLQDFFENRRTLKVNSSNKRRKRDVSSPSTARRTLNGFIVDSDYSEDELGEDNSCILIHSRVHGVGKTSLVHCIAKETSSQVFEMNCSMKRSGKIVTNTLQEVTQSNRVSIFGVSSSDAKSSVSMNGSSSANKSLMSLFFKPKVSKLSEEEERKKRIKEERRREREEKELKRKEKQKMNNLITLDANDNEDDEVITTRSSRRSKRKRIQIESDAEDENDEDAKLASKLASEQELASSKNSASNNNIASKSDEITEIDAKSNDQKTDANQKMDAKVKLSFSSNSFILFDDVDAIFNEEEDGFWKSVRNLIIESKVPVILTSSTSAINLIQDKLSDVNINLINMETPSTKDVEEHLMKILKNEAKDAKNLDVIKLINTFNCDIRRCINELQFSLAANAKVDADVEDAKSDADVDDDDLTDIEDEKDNEIIVKKKTLNCPLYEHITFIDTYQTNFNICSDETRRMKHLVHGEIDTFDEVTSERTFAMELVDYFEELYQKVSKKDTDATSDANNSMTINDHLDSLYIEDHKPSPLDSIVPELTKAVNVSNRVHVTKASISLDYLPFLVPICKNEEVKLKELIENKRRTRRFLHYFDTINLNIFCKGVILKLYDNGFMAISDSDFNELINKNNEDADLDAKSDEDANIDANKKKRWKRILNDPTDEGLRGSSDEER